jgi:ketosteroid isomerase-like protein
VNANERQIKRMFDAIDRNELEIFREVFADTIHYERPRCQPIVGIEAMIRFYRDERPIASGQHTFEQIVANDACGASWGRMRGVMRSGASVELIFSDVCEFDAQGRICKRRSYLFDPAT